MTDSVLQETSSDEAPLGWGVSLAAICIVAAIVFAFIKVISEPAEAQPSLIPLDEPAIWSNFSA
jgi:hypothetical protein